MHTTIKKFLNLKKIFFDDFSLPGNGVWGRSLFFDIIMQKNPAEMRFRRDFMCPHNLYYITSDLNNQ